MEADIAGRAEGEVVSSSEDVNAVRKFSLSPNYLLEGSRSSSPAIDLQPAIFISTNFHTYQSWPYIKGPIAVECCLT